MTSQYPRRRNSFRYPGYDYAQPGSVFVTVETHGGQRLFGAISEGAMELSPAGEMVSKRWRTIPNRFPTVAVDAFVVMPDHTHGIVMCGVDPDANTRSATVGEVVRWLKTTVHAAYGVGVKSAGWTPYGKQLWHRDYYERIIRTEAEFAAIRQYIDDNPRKWGERYGPDEPRSES